VAGSTDLSLAIGHVVMVSGAREILTGAIARV